MYASTLFFTFSVKLSRGFFWHAFNFYLQRAPSHTSLHREKTFPAALPSPGSSSVPCSKGCPMLPSCAGPRDAALPHIPRRRETNPGIPRAPGLSWYLQLPEKTATLSPYPMEWGWGGPSTDTACHRCGVSIFLKKKNQSGSLYLQKALQIICAVHIKDLHGSSTGFAHYGSQGAAAWGKEWTSVTREEMQVNF